MDELKVEKSEHEDFTFYYIMVGDRLIGFVAVTKEGRIYGCLWGVKGRYYEETQNYDWNKI